MIAQGLVFRCQKSWLNSNGITPTRGPNKGGLGSYGDFRPISHYILEKVQDRDMDTMEC